MSEGLLRELWQILQMPVALGESLRTQQILRRSLLNFLGGSGTGVRIVAEEILFRAAGCRPLSAVARGELQVQFGVPLLDSGAARRHATEEPSERWLLQLISLCVKLETLGLDIDSEAVCKNVKMLSRLKTLSVASALEDRLRKRVTVYDANTAALAGVRALRTQRGFIIQAHLDRDLKPLSLNIFGPKYNAVAEWMAHVSAENAWHIELRDAPGYKLQAAS
ncbi:MAG TPA: hypothetical protein VE986_05760 [Hyphomicrobiales bacterium]|nr:hypothetical protein [Hyphomicrobiales bacterium]